MYDFPDSHTIIAGSLIAFAILAISSLVYCAHKLAQEARANRDAEFQSRDALAIQEAAKERQEWIKGVMEGYNAPVPTENVPRF